MQRQKRNKEKAWKKMRKQWSEIEKNTRQLEVSMLKQEKKKFLKGCIQEVQGGIWKRSGEKISFFTDQNR